MMKIRSRIFAAFLCICNGQLYLTGGSTATAGTLLPPGEQTFSDSNGLPLSAGCVFFYVPGTTSPKATYLNAAQTLANTNPVKLDAAGRAIIYGTGTYRQVVQQAPCSPGSGVQVWDQLTASTDSSVTIYAGASSGTPNAITVNAPAFSGTDGQVINYVSTNTNTGGATINPSGFGAVQIVRDSATGPGVLTGGELVATNAVSLLYDATAGTFHILSPVTWPNTSGVAVGTTVAVSGFVAPTNYAFAYGQAVSRTSFSSLFSVFTSAQTGSISSGNPTITGLTDTSQFGRGQFVEAVGIPASATILSCTSTTCTMSANATTTRSGTMTFFAYGNGDGSTTFNLPDYRGLTLAGRDNMGGATRNAMQFSANLTTNSGSPTATASSSSNLSPGMFIVGNANVAPGTIISAISGTTITMSINATGTQSAVATRFSPLIDAQALGIAGGSPSETLTLAQIPTGITSPVTVNGFATPFQALGSASAFLFLANAAGSSGFGTGTQAVLTGNSATAAVSATGTATSNNTSGNAHITVQPTGLVNWAVRLTP